MRMTVRQLRQVIRETIQEVERDQLVREGFMDSVKGLFGGGTKGAKKAYNQKVYSLFYKDIKGSDGSAWWELKQHVEKTFGRSILNKLENLMDACVDQAGAASFLASLATAVQRFFSNPENVTGGDDGLGGQYIEGAELLEDGDKEGALSRVKYLLGKNVDAFVDAFKREPTSKKYLQLAGEAEERDRDAQQKYDRKKGAERAEAERKKAAEDQEIRTGQENARGYEAQRAEERRAAGAASRFADEQERAHDKSWGKKTSERYAD